MSGGVNVEKHPQAEALGQPMPRAPRMCVPRSTDLFACLTRPPHYWRRVPIHRPMLAIPTRALSGPWGPRPLSPSTTPRRGRRRLVSGPPQIQALGAQEVSGNFLTVPRGVCVRRDGDRQPSAGGRQRHQPPDGGVDSAQCREVLAEARPYRFELHDWDSLYSPWFDIAVAALGVRILRTPVHAPQANAVCEHLLGSLRRECLDFLITNTG